MTDIDFRISPTSIETLSQVLEATAAHPHESVSEIADFAGLGVSTTTGALGSLQAVQLVTKDPTGRFITKTGVTRGIGLDAAKQVLRQALIAFRPFEAMCEGLILGESQAVATRRARIRLGLAPDQEERFKTLVRWGKQLGLLEERDGKLGVAVDVEHGALGNASTAIITADDVESEAKARLYVAKRIGRDGYNDLTDEERKLLARALACYSTDAEEAVEKAGQAVENFLREIASKNGLSADAAKLNGAGQVGSLLVSKGLIHAHHLKLIDLVGGVRNAKAHHKDKRTLVPWEITTNASFMSVITAITAIRSIHEFITNNRQTL